MFVLICGSGKVGVHLVRGLIADGYEVAIIERDEDIGRTVADHFPDVCVFSGDATESSVLKRAGIERADVIVAAAGEDKDNYTICKIARRKFNVPRCVARVNEPALHELFRAEGVGAIINVTAMAAQAIESAVNS
ncbi:TrkA family potassium uptake protein [bacterium]|nr:MAG: TrkA family potassium uptake protein [bacterium]